MKTIQDFINGTLAKSETIKVSTRINKLNCSLKVSESTGNPYISVYMRELGNKPAILYTGKDKEAIEIASKALVNNEIASVNANTERLLKFITGNVEQQSFDFTLKLCVKGDEYVKEDGTKGTYQVDTIHIESILAYTSPLID